MRKAMSPVDDVEKAFSTYAYVNNKYRNRLGAKSDTRIRTINVNTLDLPSKK